MLRVASGPREDCDKSDHSHVCQSSVKEYHETNSDVTQDRHMQCTEGHSLCWRACLRLLLFGTCPPLRATALWPMPAWVWRDIQTFLFSSLLQQ